MRKIIISLTLILALILEGVAYGELRKRGEECPECIYKFINEIVKNRKKIPEGFYDKNGDYFGVVYGYQAELRMRQDQRIGMVIMNKTFPLGDFNLINAEYDKIKTYVFDKFYKKFRGIVYTDGRPENVDLKTDDRDYECIVHDHGHKFMRLDSNTRDYLELIYSIGSYSDCGFKNKLKSRTRQNSGYVHISICFECL